jgi:hypothetical protein
MYYLNNVHILTSKTKKQHALPNSQAFMRCTKSRQTHHYTSGEEESTTAQREVNKARCFILHRERQNTFPLQLAPSLQLFTIRVGCLDMELWIYIDSMLQVSVQSLL